MATDNKPITHELESVDDLQIVHLRGSLCDDGIATARQALSHVLDEDSKKIAVEMGGVDYISSSGIGMLVSMLKKSHQKHVAFALCQLTDDIHELFTLTRLDQVFTIAKDVNTWAKSL